MIKCKESKYHINPKTFKYFFGYFVGVSTHHYHHSEALEKSEKSGTTTEPWARGNLTNWPTHSDPFSGHSTKEWVVESDEDEVTSEDETPEETRSRWGEQAVEQFFAADRLQFQDSVKGDLSPLFNPAFPNYLKISSKCIF